jgi:hypothetical protein
MYGHMDIFCYYCGNLKRYPSLEAAVEDGWSKAEGTLQGKKFKLISCPDNGCKDRMNVEFGRLIDEAKNRKLQTS